MNETPQQYTKRILQQAEGQDPLTVQTTTPGKLEDLVRGVPAARLAARPSPEKWSVTEILAHLADAEIAVAWRIRQILAAPGTPIQAFDQDAWAAAGHYSRRNPQQSLQQFSVLRQTNLSLLNLLTPEQWKHHGMHAERGLETIEHMVKMIAGHDLNHLKQVETILQSHK
jgi:hypothetical protein